MRIGVDTGGTFTDCVVFEGSRVEILKVFSTPDDAGRAILKGVKRIVGERPPVLLDVIHGTTVGTNSLLERRGARVALVTTSGFEDLIEIGRQARPRLYDLNVRRDPPLVPRGLRWGVEERVAADGKILLRPTAKELRRLGERIKRAKAESIALCFLFSFANPTNERAVARVLRSLGLPVSASHEILPEFREYERLSTVAINAFLAPRLGKYLAGLERSALHSLYAPKLGSESVSDQAARSRKPRRGQTSPARIYVMQSSGGITTAARAAREPVRTILSGPAGGVVGAAWLAGQLRIPRAISFDMGGTSTDVCLLDGAPRTTNETTLGGLPVAVPVLDVHSVGAGGGSLAHLDAGGALRVGPESAGARPGPICYRRGGIEPTVTDANLLLGRLDAEYFLGGTFQLDLKSADTQFARFLRREHGRLGATSRAFKSALELARGIVAVSNATMEKALRVISVERGHDPRDFVLICFGGAGGMHAAALARSLGMRRIIVPPNPGAFSAVGILLSDTVKDVSQSILLDVPSSEAIGSPQFQRFLSGLARRLEQLEKSGRAELEREQFPGAEARVERRLDVRYVGQAYELPVPFTADFRARFHREHEKAYGYAHVGRLLEIVNLRLRLVIPTPKPKNPPRRTRPTKAAESPNAQLKRKPVWFGARSWPTPVYDRERLGPGTQLMGPAVVVEYSSTTVVPPDFVCHVDEFRNLVLRQR